MADPQRKWVSDDVLTYTYLLLYVALSSGQIFFNKWVLSSKEINFPYPLGLTLLHMIFSSVLCFVVTKVLKIMKVEEGMTLDIYLSSVIPIGAMFAMTLWLGNTAYLYISVSFAQMLKAIMPVAVFILGVAAGLEMMSCRMLLIMSVISFGVLVASYGEIDINWVGVVYQMGGVVGEALRLIFMEILVKRKGLKLNPISVMYYVSPCRHVALCLLVPWIFLEKPKMDEQRSWSFQPLILTLNSLCTFALNLSVFLVIQHTSALTIRVAGVVKDWVVVLLSALLFADTKLTLINLFGYAIGDDRSFHDNLSLLISNSVHQLSVRRAHLRGGQEWSDGSVGRNSHGAQFEIPYFEGDDHCSWLRKCDRYFHYNGIIDLQKLDVVLHLNDKAEYYFFSYYVSKDTVWDKWFQGHQCKNKQLNAISVAVEEPEGGAEGPTAEILEDLSSAKVEGMDEDISLNALSGTEVPNTIKLEWNNKEESLDCATEFRKYTQFPRYGDY
ncbi:putative sugar phosphate/phosphate translocator [Capsicum annuum]|nr:putative sugar phosphate/phosphate translocator [Capsicum annuum]